VEPNQWLVTPVIWSVSRLGRQSHHRRQRPSGVRTPNAAATRPAPARASVRPEAASGLDGWLMERLFGR
jgi:penicillin-binding protein 1A